MSSTNVITSSKVLLNHYMLVTKVLTSSVIEHCRLNQMSPFVFLHCQRVMVIRIGYGKKLGRYFGLSPCQGEPHFGTSFSHTFCIAAVHFTSREKLAILNSFLKTFSSPKIKTFEKCRKVQVAQRTQFSSFQILVATGAGASWLQLCRRPCSSCSSRLQVPAKLCDIRKESLLLYTTLFDQVKWFFLAIKDLYRVAIWPARAWLLRISS